MRGIDFINDSKATNVNSCWYALQSMTTKTVLILGGKDKGNDYTEIEDLVRENVQHWYIWDFITKSFTNSSTVSVCR